MDAVAFPDPPVIGLVVLAEGAHVHHEDADLRLRIVLERHVGLLGRVHAAHGGAVVVFLIAGTDALQEGDFLRRALIGRPPHLARGRPGGAEQAFVLEGGHNIGETAQAEFLGHLGLIGLEAGRHDHRADLDPAVPARHIEIDGVDAALAHAALALGAHAAG